MAVTVLLSFMLVVALQISLCQVNPAKHVCKRAWRFSKGLGHCVPCTVACLEGEGQERNCGYNESGDRVRNRCHKCEHGALTMVRVTAGKRKEYRVCACPPGYYDGEPFGTPGCTKCGPCCRASLEHLARAECQESGMGIQCSCAPNSQHLCAAGPRSDLVQRCNAIHDNLTKYRLFNLEKKMNISKIIKPKGTAATTPVGPTRTMPVLQMTDTSPKSASAVTTTAYSLPLKGQDLKRKSKTTTTVTTTTIIKRKSPKNTALTRRSNYHDDSRNANSHSSSTMQMKTNDNFTISGNESVKGKTVREFLLQKISSTKTANLEDSSDREIPTKPKTREHQLSTVIGVTAALTCIIITVIAIVIMKCKSTQHGRRTNGQEASLQESQPLDRNLKNPLEAVEGCMEDTAGGAEREPLNKAVPFNYEDENCTSGPNTPHEVTKVEGLRRCQRTFLIQKLDTESQGFTNWKELAQHFGVAETTIDYWKSNYRAGQSPTESLINHMISKNIHVRGLLQALDLIGRKDVIESLSKHLEDKCKLCRTTYAG